MASGERQRMSATRPDIPRGLAASGDPRRPRLGPAARRGATVLRAAWHGELLAQGQVLEGELAVAAAEKREEAAVEQEGDHRAEMISGSVPIDQLLARRTEFWRRTGCETIVDRIRSPKY